MCRNDNTIEATEQENVPKLDFPNVFFALISQVSAYCGCFAYRSQPYFILEQQKTHEQRITFLTLFYVKFG